MKNTFKNVWYFSGQFDFGFGKSSTYFIFGRRRLKSLRQQRAYMPMGGWSYNHDFIVRHIYLTQFYTLYYSFSALKSITTLYSNLKKGNFINQCVLKELWKILNWNIISLSVSWFPHYVPLVTGFPNA